MSVLTGQDGVIKIGTVSVAELRNFSVETSTETIENTVMTDTARGYLAGLQSWSGSADIFYDPATVTAISALTGGRNQGGAGDDNVAFLGYPQGITAGLPQFSGDIIITSFSISSSMDGMVEASISFTGTGPYSLTGVAP